LGKASWSPKKWWNQKPPQRADRIFVKGAKFNNPPPFLRRRRASVQHHDGAVVPVDNIMTQVIPAMAQFTSAASISSSPLSMPWMPDTAPPPAPAHGRGGRVPSRRHARRGFGFHRPRLLHLLVPNGLNFLLLLLLLLFLLLSCSACCFRRGRWSNA
jgi:hypothetical protein